MTGRLVAKAVKMSFMDDPRFFATLAFALGSIIARGAEWVINLHLVDHLRREQPNEWVLAGSPSIVRYLAWPENKTYSAWLRAVRKREPPDEYSTRAKKMWVWRCISYASIAGLFSVLLLGP